VKNKAPKSRTPAVRSFRFASEGQPELPFSILPCYCCLL
jgi:hypothetical protein